LGVPLPLHALHPYTGAMVPQIWKGTICLCASLENYMSARLLALPASPVRSNTISWVFVADA